MSRTVWLAWEMCACPVYASGWGFGYRLIVFERRCLSVMSKPLLCFEFVIVGAFCEQTIEHSNIQSRKVVGVEMGEIRRQ
jgi:hypothetical protein